MTWFEKIVLFIIGFICGVVVIHIILLSFL